MENNLYSEEIEKVVNQQNTSCPMYGTPECSLLNMETCSECPVGNMKPEKQEKAKKALGRLMNAAPPHMVEPLLSSDTCLLCKDEEPEKAECWAFFDLKKPDPEGDWTIALGTKKVSVKGADMILPLQVACCKKCRSAYRLFAYLPTICALLTAALVLCAVSVTPVYRALFTAADWLPFAVMAAGVLLAFAVNCVMKVILAKDLRKKMRADVSEIPAVRALMDRGFTEVNEKKFGVSAIVFADSARKTGVYTAVREKPVTDGDDEPTICGEPAVDPETGEEIPESIRPKKMTGRDPRVMGKYVMEPEEEEKPEVCGVWPADVKKE